MHTTSPICGPMPAEEYHADHSAISNSMLKTFRQRRKIYHHQFVLGNPVVKKVTAKMDLGTLVHAALLEPEKLNTHFAVYPKSVLKSNGALGTNASDKFEAENAGRICLKEEAFEAAEKMVAAVRDQISQWLNAFAMIEHAIFWTDPITGLRCKCRPDFLVISEHIKLCIDIKSTGDASPEEFEKIIANLGYWMQDSHYCEGIEAKFGGEAEFILVAVENEWPHECAIHRIDPINREQGREKRWEALAGIAECHQTGDWREPWTKDINEISMKPWSIK